jgi:hypothetical protein
MSASGPALDRSESIGAASRQESGYGLELVPVGVQRASKPVRGPAVHVPMGICYLA